MPCRSGIMPYLFFCDWPTSLSIMVLFITLTGVMGLQVYAYVQAHQVVHIKYVQDFLYINYASIKLLKKKKKTNLWGNLFMYMYLTGDILLQNVPGWGLRGEWGVGGCGAGGNCWFELSCLPCTQQQSREPPCAGEGRGLRSCPHCRNLQRS